MSNPTRELLIRFLLNCERDRRLKRLFDSLDDEAGSLAVLMDDEGSIELLIACRSLELGKLLKRRERALLRIAGEIMGDTTTLTIGVFDVLPEAMTRVQCDRDGSELTISVLDGLGL